MTPGERRAHLVHATIPLLLEQGRTVTTKQIADAAGVAEGTIFRVFDSKDDLITEALVTAFDFAPFLADLRAIEPAQSLEHLVSDIVTMMRIRFQGIFALMNAVGIVAPPLARQHTADQRAEVGRVLTELLTPYAQQLTCSPEEFAHIARLLTFAGSHTHIADGRTLTADRITAILLHGMLRKDPD